jgi:hypothetical protein
VKAEAVRKETEKERKIEGKTLEEREWGWIGKSRTTGRVKNGGIEMKWGRKFKIIIRKVGD